MGRNPRTNLNICTTKDSVTLHGVALFLLVTKIIMVCILKYRIILLHKQSDGMSRTDGKVGCSNKSHFTIRRVLMEQEARFYPVPYLMNLELTSKCPLKCPQCYCDLQNGRNLDYQTALKWLDNAARIGVEYINLSGGETMCYPQLIPMLEYISDKGMKANVALSGYGFGKTQLMAMKKAKINEICISLNGPTKEINECSREGFELAIAALQLLKEERYQDTCINWVMHQSNADHLQAMVDLSEEYQIKELVIMVFKPDSEHERKGLPTLAQLKATADIVKKHQGEVTISVESCFTQLRILLSERFWGNVNRGINKGCGAGRDGISINLEGKLTPCRHLEFAEDYQSIEEYWQQSLVLEKLRTVEDAKEEVCQQCRYNKYCLPCMAINVKTKGKIAFGEEDCRLAIKEVI